MIDIFGKYYDVFIRCACLIVAILFIIRYNKVNWRATSDGRHIMAFTAMIAAFLILVICTWIFGRQPWIIWAGRAVFGWALFLLIQRVYLQRVAQKEAESGADKPEDKPPISVPDTT